MKDTMHTFMFVPLSESEPIFAGLSSFWLYGVDAPKGNANTVTSGDGVVGRSLPVGLRRIEDLEAAAEEAAAAKKPQHPLARLFSWKPKLQYKIVYTIDSRTGSDAVDSVTGKLAHDGSLARPLASLQEAQRRASLGPPGIQCMFNVVHMGPVEKTVDLAPTESLASLYNTAPYVPTGGAT